MQTCVAVFRFNYLAFDPDIKYFQKQISDFLKKAYSDQCITVVICTDNCPQHTTTKTKN